YAASGINRIMPTPGLCRVPWLRRHNCREDPCFWSSDLSALSRVLEESKQWVGRLISSWREAARSSVRECVFLKSHVGMQVYLGCLWRFMTEPKGNHAQIHSTL